MIAAAVTAAIGCADDTSVTDAGPDGSADGGMLVTPPDIPWLAEGAPPIMLAPCPEGWHEVLGGAVTECDPYPPEGPEACDAGEAHFPGEPGCRPIGDACPTGDYATSLPTDGPVVYVKAGAPAGGDGSLAAPYAGFSDVPWFSLRAPTVVALAKGSYEGVAPLGAGMTVTGACARETVVTGFSTMVPSALGVTGPGEPAVFENLTVRGTPQRGVAVGEGTRMSLRGVLFDRVRGLGIFAQGDGAVVTLSDVVIRDTQPSGLPTFEYGIGIFLQLGARLEATRLIVEGNRGIGVAVTHGASASLTDSVVRDTVSRDSDGGGGRGINVQAGASFEGTRILVARNRTIGVFLIDADSEVTLTDAVVRDTESRESDGEDGRGITVQGGALLTATRLLVANSRDVGVFVGQTDARVVFTDAVIRDTQVPASGAHLGRGLNIQGGGRVEATRFVLSGNVEGAAFVASPESYLSVTDALVQDTVSSPVDPEAGGGVSVQFGAHFEATRMVVTNNAGHGLLGVSEGTFLGLSDVVVRDTQPRANDGRFGRGLIGQSGARVEATRLEVDRSFEVGVMAIADAVVVLTDTSIRGAEVADCASTSCSGDPYGYGVGTYAASLSLTRFQVTDGAVCGVMVSPLEGYTSPSSLDLDAGLVATSEIGVCVQVDGYDLSRLMNDVAYLDNGTNLDTTALPVPDLATPPEL
ncbi:MAG: hypothetical protein DRJ42_23050 [Deltaproteobacteria bacterium]|nr:MAG: hypothetical protein DRJ42_23050 [Deltaproteobacteria bacterium]